MPNQEPAKADANQQAKSQILTHDDMQWSELMIGAAEKHRQVDVVIKCGRHGCCGANCECGKQAIHFYRLLIPPQAMGRDRSTANSPCS
jgi:hypothetical protein